MSDPSEEAAGWKDVSEFVRQWFPNVASIPIGFTEALRVYIAAYTEAAVKGARARWLANDMSIDSALAQAVEAAVKEVREAHDTYCDAPAMVKAKIAECHRWADRVNDLKARLASAEGELASAEAYGEKERKHFENWFERAAELQAERNTLKAERDEHKELIEDYEADLQSAMAAVEQAHAALQADVPDEGKHELTVRVMRILASAEGVAK